MEYFPSHQKLAQIAALSRDAFANLLCVLERMLAFAGPGDHDTHRLTHDESLRALAAAATGQKQHKTNACLDDLGTVPADALSTAHSIEEVRLRGLAECCKEASEAADGLPFVGGPNSAPLVRGLLRLIVRVCVSCFILV